MKDPARIATDKKLDEMIARLTEIYTDAQKNVGRAAQAFFADFARLDEKRQKMVERGIWTEKEYEDWRTNKLLYSDRFRKLNRIYAEELLHVNETVAKYINGELPEIYAINYNTFGQDTPYFEGMSFTLVDADTVRFLSQADESLLPYKKLDPAKDVPWNMRKVNSEVLQGILVGDNIPKIAKRMENVTGANLVSAVRAARTLVTGAENRGRYDKMHRMEEMGIVSDKEWMATNDNRVRDSHAAINGEEQPTDELFSNGLMYPGDPNGAPAEVYNCRCTMVTNVKGFRNSDGTISKVEWSGA